MIIVDGYYELANDRCKDVSIDPKTDSDAATLIAVQAIVATVWWGIMLFTYTKNVVGLKIFNKSMSPIEWAFAMLSDKTYGFTAAAYLTNFLIYGAIALPELAAYILYLFGENEWYGWYPATIGLYGSIFLMPIPPIMATL